MNQLRKGLQWTTALAVVLAFESNVTTLADVRCPAASRAEVAQSPLAPMLAYTYSAPEWRCTTCPGSGCDANCWLTYPGNRVVTPSGSTTGGNDSTPAWSPDGLHVAFVRNADIFVMNADASNPVPVAATPANEYSPEWSPDGQTIAFASDRDGLPGIYLMNPDGSNVRQVALPVALSFNQLSWSPDSTRIAFTCLVDSGNSDVCAVDADGGNFARLTSDAGHDASPAWSPDGSRIAFATTRFNAVGNPQIAYMNPDGTGDVLAIAMPSWSPAWSPDGRQLAFSASGGEFGSIYVMRADDSSSATEVVVDASEAAWMPGTVATFEHACANETCSFDAVGSVGNITEYRWTFGDGSTGTGATVVHPYADGGSYNVTLTVTDVTGATASETRNINVNRLPVVVLTSSCVALTCTVDWSASYDPDGAGFRSYFVTFGDGTSGDSTPASHTYLSAGTYTVTVRVTDAFGETATGTTTVTPTVAPPRPEMHVGDLDATAGPPPGPWIATVKVFVHDADHRAVPNAVVSATWAHGGSVSCITNNAGYCTVTSGRLSAKTSTGLTVSSVAHSTFAYSPVANHDADGDSTGTVIAISR